MHWLLFLVTFWPVVKLDIDKPVFLTHLFPRRSSRCRYLHPKDLERLNYTLSDHYDRQGQIRMALKSAGFLAAIERGARFIFQANPGEALLQSQKSNFVLRHFSFLLFVYLSYVHICLHI